MLTNFEHNDIEHPYITKHLTDLLEKLQSSKKETWYFGYEIMQFKYFYCISIQIYGTYIKVEYIYKSIP